MNSGFQYWRDNLGAPRHIVAPMVDASELAWRMLSRRYGAELCYTPMFHACSFVQNATYRRDNVATCAGDRPLITQFCSNDPEIFTQAAKLAIDGCDGVDLNLGCPQIIAKRGFYGAFLQDEWQLIRTMLGTVHTRYPDIPISCKCRIFPEVERTVQYAKMLEDSGCKLLTVHGRTRDQKGNMTGVASWSHIKAVKQHVNIPVFANGNIQFYSDVDRCSAETGVDGVMTAEGNLHNPAIFDKGPPRPSYEMALEYLDLVNLYPCPLSYSRGHLFKLFHHSMSRFIDLRDRLGRADSLDELRQVTLELQKRCEPLHCSFLDSSNDIDLCELQSDTKLPHWICQPYVRPRPDTLSANGRKPNRTEDEELARKRKHEELAAQATLLGVSKKRVKKMSRNPHKDFSNSHCNDLRTKCICENLSGMKCDRKMCAGCCRAACLADPDTKCIGHRFGLKHTKPANTDTPVV